MTARSKGQEGEREIAAILNGLVNEVRQSRGLVKLNTNVALFQRNQNQSAVGGDDLTNPLHLSIEIKRQEQLSINSWWNQCIVSAQKQNYIPILLFRQNRKPWRCCMETSIPLMPQALQPLAASNSYGPCRVEIDFNEFKNWFRNYYKLWLG